MAQSNTAPLDQVEIVAFTNPHRRQFADYLCPHFRQINSTRTFVIDRDPNPSTPDKFLPINAAKVDSMIPLLNRCRQIKCLLLDASPCVEFADIDTLKKLFNALPELECFYYGRFEINKFNDSEWLVFCQEIGHKIKHLTLKDRTFWPSEMTIVSMINSVSNSLDFLFFTATTPKEFHWLKSLRNLQSVELSIDCNKHSNVANYEVDADSAAVISQAKNLSILFLWLRSAARHCPSFDKVNRLQTVDLGIGNNLDSDIKFPKFPNLENLNFVSQSGSSIIIIDYLSKYNLPGLKSLTIESTAINDVFTALADKLTSLKKLFIKNSTNHLPGNSLLRMKQLEDLAIQVNIGSKDVLPTETLKEVIKMFYVVGEMRWLKRLEIHIDHFFDYLDPISEDLEEHLTLTLDDIRNLVPSAVIDFPLLYEWLAVNEISYFNY